MYFGLLCKLAKENNELLPKPFQIFLYGGAGIRKSFLIIAVSKYLKQVLRYSNQNLDPLSVLVTESTRKAATGVSGITLHSSFNQPDKSRLKSYGYKKPSD